MERKLPILIIMMILLAAIIAPFACLPNPEHCALCDLVPCHAPYPINLHTGEAGILEVYNINQINPTELDSWQHSGTFSFVEVAGIQGYRDTANWEVHIFLPEKLESYNPAHFCSFCRKLIYPFKKDGYLIIDNYDSKIPIVYSVGLNEQHSFRCYDVSIIMSDNEKLEIIARGSFSP